jgi:hypothetical protein
MIGLAVTNNLNGRIFRKEVIEVIKQLQERLSTKKGGVQ